MWVTVSHKTQMLWSNSSSESMSGERDGIETSTRGDNKFLIPSNLVIAALS